MKVERESERCQVIDNILTPRDVVEMIFTVHDDVTFHRRMRCVLMKWRMHAELRSLTRFKKLFRSCEVATNDTLPRTMFGYDVDDDMSWEEFCEGERMRKPRGLS
jgi:hypothetical protein